MTTTTRKRKRQLPWWYDVTDPRRAELIRETAAKCPLETKVRGLVRIIEEARR